MKLKLIKKVDEARGTKSFFWEPDKPVSFLPGQYLYYTLPKLSYPDPRGSTRHFTVSSSPTEGNILRLTTRIRQESGYKKTLDELPIGSVIDGEGPQGTLILDESEKGKNHIFLAGGIGITPFRTFIKYNVDNKLQIPMHLIYCNGDPEFVYKTELAKLDKEHDFIKVDFFDTSKLGHLDEKGIKKLVPGPNLLTSTYWLVGPPPFIDAIEIAVEKLRISGNQIRSEKFTGY